ncbi:hypothetical protein BJX65DRAFT_270978 [Aspergillus insuetus]
MVTFLTLITDTVPSQPTFPTELIWQIIDCLIPSESALIPTHNAVTRTLLSLSLASRLTHYKAHELLMTYCIHLSSQRALKTFNTTSQGCLPDCEAQCRRQAQSMVLAPFTHRNQVTPASARDIDATFSMLAGTLRRLVLDFPWRGFYPESGGYETAIILGRAFRRLSAIEEFVSIADGLPLDVPSEEPDYQYVAWSTWPRLRRLSLRSPRIDTTFVEALLGCRHLTHLVVAEPRALEHPLPGDLANRVSWAELGLRRMTIVSHARQEYWLQNEEYREHYPEFESSLLGRLMRTFEERLRGSTVHPKMGYVGIRCVMTDPIDRIDAWLHQHALGGTIWDSHGQLYEPVV